MSKKFYDSLDDMNNTTARIIKMLPIVFAFFAKVALFSLTNCLLSKKISIHP
jgi:hypothetical protein